MADRDHEAFASFLSEESVFFSGPTPLRGKRQVAAWWKRYYEGPEAPFSWEPERVEVLDSGGLALTTGPVRDPDGKVVATFTRMAVLHPLKVVITNYPEQQVEQLDAANHPQDESMGARKIPFCRELYIERADFEEVPPKKFKRLIPGGEVRLRNSYVIRCDEIIKNNQGEIIELRCSYDTKTLNVNPEGRKVQGVIHWVSARHAVADEVRLDDRLFTHPTPDDGKDGVDYKQRLNPDSLRVLTDCYVEASLASAQSGERFQFEREGYFCRDINDSAGKPVFNMTVGLKDSWVKEQQK